MDWNLAGLIIGILALLAGIVFGSYHIYQAQRHKGELSDALAKAKTDLGNALAGDLRELGRVTLENTSKELEKLGEVTLKSIDSVHKSIKEELKDLSKSETKS